MHVQIQNWHERNQAPNELREPIFSVDLHNFDHSNKWHIQLFRGILL